MSDHPGQNGSPLEDWNRRVAASREIRSSRAASSEVETRPSRDHGMHCTTDRIDDLWLDADPPWTWSAIATLLAALAAGGALVWWATA